MKFLMQKMSQWFLFFQKFIIMQFFWLNIWKTDSVHFLKEVYLCRDMHLFIYFNYIVYIYENASVYILFPEDYNDNYWYLVLRYL